MTKNGVLIFFGVLIVASLTYGAYAFGKILTDRSIPSLDERVDLMKQHQSFNTQFERTEFVKRLGAARRPTLNLYLAAAGDCEILLDSAEFYFKKAGEIALRHEGKDLTTLKATGSAQDAALLDSFTLVALHMADAYDNCLGNP